MKAKAGLNRLQRAAPSKESIDSDSIVLFAFVGPAALWPPTVLNRQVATDSPARGTSRRRFSLKTPGAVTPIHGSSAFSDRWASFSGISELLSLKVWPHWPRRARQSEPYPDTLPEPPLLAGQEETHALAHDGKPVSGVQNMESEGEQEPLAWTKVAFPEKTLDLLLQRQKRLC